jgi:predicted SnoaL-like aldol condensation-catalyzing enzyme
MAEGDRVMLFTKREVPGGNDGQPSFLYIFNMFRVQDGKLAEHWDAGAPPGGAAAAGAANSERAVHRP